MTRTLSPGALRWADEVSVVICAIAGDDNAYGELVRRRQNTIRQLFRRLCREPALADLIVSGFCREVFKELPMEFAVEAQNLLAVSLEGAVG